MLIGLNCCQEERVKWLLKLLWQEIQTAEKRHCSTAVSHAIAELEQQAGTALFDRLPRGVCLTSCGTMLLKEARSILASCRSLDQRISHLEECTPVNIVSSITIASFHLPQILNRLKAVLPELQVNVRVASANSAMGILQNGEADIAFWEGVEPQGAFRGRSGFTATAA